MRTYYMHCHIESRQIREQLDMGKREREKERENVKKTEQTIANEHIAS